MYDYTRNDFNIMVYIDFERDREGDELFHFFALKSVQNATFENEVFAWWEKVKGDVLDDEKEKGPQISCVSYANRCFESIGAYMDL